jgi:hypothetical protein
LEKRRVLAECILRRGRCELSGLPGAVDGCTQPTHVHIDTVGLRNEFVVLCIIDKSCARQQLAAPLHRLLEQLEFARTQTNREIELQ